MAMGLFIIQQMMVELSELLTALVSGETSPHNLEAPLFQVIGAKIIVWVHLLSSSTYFRIFLKFVTLTADPIPTLRWIKIIFL